MRFLFDKSKFSIWTLGKQFFEIFLNPEFETPRQCTEDLHRYFQNIFKLIFTELLDMKLFVRVYMYVLCVVSTL